MVKEHLGDAYLKKGNKKKALELYERALKLDPKKAELKNRIEGMKKELKGK